MRQRLTKIALFTAFSVTLAACDGSSGFKSSAKKNDTGSGSNDPESESASEPSQVAGAFLSCYYLPPSGLRLDSTSESIGCAVAKDGKKVDITGMTVKLKYYDEDGSVIDVETREDGQTSPWHFEGNVPVSWHGRGKYSAAATAGTRTKTMSMDANRMKIYDPASEDLGNYSDSTLDGASTGSATAGSVPVAPEDVPLPFKVHSSFVRPKLGSGFIGMLANIFIGNIHIRDFCRGGNGVSSFSPETETFLSNNGLSALAKPPLATASGKQLLLKEIGCFQSINDMDYGQNGKPAIGSNFGPILSDDMSDGNGKCLIFGTTTTIYTFSGNADSAVPLQNVKDFINSHGC